MKEYDNRKSGKQECKAKKINWRSTNTIQEIINKFEIAQNRTHVGSNNELESKWAQRIMTERLQIS